MKSAPTVSEQPTEFPWVVLVLSNDNAGTARVVSWHPTQDEAVEDANDRLAQARSERMTAFVVVAREFHQGEVVV